MDPSFCSVFGGIRGVIYYELLKPNETITGDRYLLQLIRLSRALKKNGRNTAKTTKVILLHDNARPHVAKPVKRTWERCNGTFYLTAYPDIALQITTYSDLWHMA
ncbi:Mariner Mos1 transposase [Eumeta japonica]|uniref:Mariner Mos1 transposase n=1 Tax=Eumeta variegata TaxID=151549 RepID=A0A4C2ADC7_EUMVA|nr:Mariner Mos1 transposase [Eumeta japonica]